MQSNKREGAGVLGSPAPLAKRFHTATTYESTTHDASDSPNASSGATLSPIKNSRQLAPPPPLVSSFSTINQRQRQQSRAVADRLRLRLQVAYYKVRTKQETVPLSEVTNSML